MKFKKLTTIFLTAVFIFSASASALAAGSYADQVPVKMGRAISERLVKPETPMYITCENNKGDWSIMVRGGYVKHITGEHVDYVAEYTGLSPWSASEIVFSGNCNTPDKWELLSVNGVVWQNFDSPERVPFEKSCWTDETLKDFGLTREEVEAAEPKISDEIQSAMNNIEAPYSCVRQELPKQGKEMISVYNDRTAVALYEYDKVRAEHLKARPFMKDGQMFVPLRGIADYLGTEIGWNNTTKTIILKQGERTINLQASEVVIKDGNTMIPLSFLSGQLGYTVKWMGDIKDDVLRADIYN